MMTDSRISKSVIKHVRVAKLITQIVNWLGEKNEKLLAIIVDIIKLLLEKDSEQKVKKFLNIKKIIIFLVPFC